MSGEKRRVALPVPPGRAHLEALQAEVLVPAGATPPTAEELQVLSLAVADLFGVMLPAERPEDDLVAQEWRWAGRWWRAQ